MICYGAHLYINVHYSWEQKNNNNILFSWFIKIIRLPFFFSFFILSCLSLSLSFTLISQAHSLNFDHRPTKLAVDQSAWLGNPWSSSLIRVLAYGYWFFHAANGCFFFFFFLLCTSGGGVDGVCGCDCVCIWW